MFLKGAQWVVVVSSQLAALSVGGAVIFPSVLMRQLLNEPDIDLDLRTASWMGSIHGIGGIPTIFIPWFMQWKGRRLAFIATSLILTAGWVVAYFAKSAALILLSESLHGFGTNSLLAVTMLSVSEMVSPDYKNVCMVTFLVLQTFTMGVTGVLEKYLNWRTLCLIMCVPVICAAILGCTWPESPAWLAWKGNDEQCTVAFKRLRGTNSIIQQELTELIDKQKECDAVTKDSFMQIRSLMSKSFYLPCSHMFLLLNLTYWSGSIVILIYGEQIFETLSHDVTAASYATIVGNFINFGGVLLSTILLRYLNNRSLILFSGIGGTVCLIWCSLCWQAVWAVVALTAVNSLGLTTVIFSVAAELIPIRHRGPGGALYVLCTCSLHASSLKAAPYLIQAMGSRMMLLYAANAAICSLLVWRFLPETKGKTLVQIEECYDK